MENESKSQSFEESLKELESLVKRFEEGQFTLDEAIAAYERGFFLKEQCLVQLQQAKAKIEMVMADKSPILKTDSDISSENNAMKLADAPVKTP